MAKLSFLEVVLSAVLLASVILWKGTSSVSLGPHSSTVTEETLTTSRGPDICDGVPCPPDRYCVFNRTENSTDCICKEFCIGAIYDPVCGSDWQTYDNECNIPAVACRKNTTITILYRGMCKEKTPSNISEEYMTTRIQETTTTGRGRMSTWKTEPETNGLGTSSVSLGPHSSTVTEETLTTSRETPSNISEEYLTTRIQENTTTGRETMSTWKTEPETSGLGPDICDGVPCPPDRYCVFNRTENSTDCICKEFCIGAIYDPVCGSDWQTYDNECNIPAVACRKNTTITILYRGMCKEKTPSNISEEYMTTRIQETTTTGRGRMSTWKTEPETSGLGASSVSLGPHSSTVTEETLTTSRETPSNISEENLTTKIQETTTTGRGTMSTWKTEPETSGLGPSSVSLGPHSSTVTEETLSTSRGPDICDGVPCPPDRYCVFNRTENSTDCICKEFCIGAIYDPVCGSDWQTYDNECNIPAVACRENKTITILYRGMCKEKHLTTKTQETTTTGRDRMSTRTREPKTRASETHSNISEEYLTTTTQEMTTTGRERMITRKAEPETRGLVW